MPDVNPVTFFTPDDPLKINASLGASDALRWIVQTNAPSVTLDRASGLGAEGDELAHHEHNAKETLSLTYKCYAASGVLLLPSVGEVYNGYHIDSVKLAYSPTDWPTLTVSAHKHLASSGTHAKDSCRTYSPLLKFPAQYCIPSSLSDDKASFAMDTPGVGMRSLSYDLSCSHVDETGSCGDWLAGDNHDGVEKLDSEFTGEPGSGLIIDPSWTRTSDSRSEGNTAVNTRTISLERHIAHD